MQRLPLERPELVSLIQSVLDDITDEQRIHQVSTTIQERLGPSDFSDALFWPDHFFGADADVEPSADSIADVLLQRARTRPIFL